MPPWLQTELGRTCLPLRETPLRKHFNEFMARQLLPQPTKTIETNSITTLLMLMKSMLLIALAQPSMIRDGTSRGQVGVTQLTMLPQPDPIGLIWPNKTALPPLARAFHDGLLALANGEDRSETF